MRRFMQHSGLQFSNAMDSRKEAIPSLCARMIFEKIVCSDAVRSLVDCMFMENTVT